MSDQSDELVGDELVRLAVELADDAAEHTRRVGDEMVRHAGRVTQIAERIIEIAAGTEPGPEPGPSPGWEDLDLPASSALHPEVVDEALRRVGRLFPPHNWWNQDVSAAPVDPRSDELIARLQADIEHRHSRSGLHPEFAAVEWGTPPLVVVDERTPMVEVTYSTEYGERESDSPPMLRIPAAAITEPGWIQGNTAGGGPSGDRHISILDVSGDMPTLYEAWRTMHDGGRWTVGSFVFWAIGVNRRRPEGYTSASADGISYAAGLVRHDEVYRDREIEHAVRMTVWGSDPDVYVWPANHLAGRPGVEGPDLLPYGARLRMRPDYDASRLPAEVRKLCRAWKRYGIHIADNGGAGFVTGTADPRWDNSILNPALHSIPATAFEVIELGWRPDSDYTPVPELPGDEERGAHGPPWGDTDTSPPNPGPGPGPSPIEAALDAWRARYDATVGEANVVGRAMEAETTDSFLARYKMDPAAVYLSLGAEDAGVTLAARFAVDYLLKSNMPADQYALLRGVSLALQHAPDMMPDGLVGWAVRATSSLAAMGGQWWNSEVASGALEGIELLYAQGRTIEAGEVWNAVEGRELTADLQGRRLWALGREVLAVLSMRRHIGQDVVGVLDRLQAEIWRRWSAGGVGGYGALWIAPALWTRSEADASDAIHRGLAAAWIDTTGKSSAAWTQSFRALAEEYWL